MKQTILEQLFALQDLPYRDFNAALIPSIHKETVIGVRVPALRKLAKALQGSPEAAAFLRQLPHRYYEENLLHGLLVAQERDFDRVLAETQRFLPYMDNWAVCDLFYPKVFDRHAQALLPHIRRWIASRETYTIRFGLGLLMRLFLDERFAPEYLELAAGIESEEYYVNMMVAWYFATALAKQKEAALPYLTDRRLSTWTHNKTIQKAIESYRIDDDTKTFLRQLRIKKAQRD